MRAVIPAGGFGTRMLPATKSMPKEMLPVLNKPVIQYVVEEAFDSGAEDVLVVTGRNKRAIEDHFDEAPELAAFLRERGKEPALAELSTLNRLGRIFYVRQSAPLGLGHAVLQAAPFVRTGPFAVLLGDDIIVGEMPATKQLRLAHERHGASIISVQPVSDADVGRYGIVEAEEVEPGLHRVHSIVEKPKLKDAPSNLAVMGRYVFTPTILEELARTSPGHGGEIQLTDAIQSLLAREPVYALEFQGTRYDIGTVQGWINATLQLALDHPEYKEETRALVHRLRN